MYWAVVVTSTDHDKRQVSKGMSSGNLLGAYKGAPQLVAKRHESSDRIGMMHTNRSDYLRTRRAQVAVNYSNSLDF